MLNGVVFFPPMAGLKRGLALVCFLLAEIMIAAEIIYFGLQNVTAMFV